MHAIVLSLALTMGCGNTDDDTGADGLTLTNVRAQVSEAVTTVVTVTWSTSESTQGYVAYGENLRLTTPLTAPGTEHSAVLLGLTASTEHSYKVIAATAADTIESEAQTITTGILPNELPSITTAGDGQDGWITLPIIGGTTGPIILDEDGNIVWYHIDDRDLDVYRARLSVDGESLLYNAASVSGDPADNSVMVRVALDGSWESTIDVPLLAHDFVEHTDGTIAAIVVEYRDYDGEEIRGDQLVEIAPDGTQSVVWSAWDCFDPAEVGGDDAEYGWTFANALDFDEDSDAYYLSMRNFSSIAKIDRASGSCTWVIGNEGATIELDAGSSSFLHQHQFEVTDSGLVVFDNEGAAGTVSRVLEYEIDWEAGTGSEVWSYTAEPTIYNFVLGDVERMDNGDTLVVWSVAGQVDRVDANANVTWQLNTDLGYALGFMTPSDDLYPAR